MKRPRRLGSARVLHGAFVLILVGLGLGLPLSVAAGRLLRTQLYDMSGHDVGVTAVSIAVLGFSALAASAIPALRASRIPPAGALRAE